MANASGKYAKAISDRSGLEFPYNPATHKSDAESLSDSRPSRKEPTVVFVGTRTLFDQNDTMSPQKQNPVLMQMNISPVTVSIS